MANSGGGGGGDVVIPISPRAQQSSGGRQPGHSEKAAWLPLDIIVTEIAARSDPATLVRCAATCRAARRRVAEDACLRGSLRLRDTGRFVLPLLRGHLAGTTSYDHESGRVKTNLYLVDTTTGADGPRLVEATFASAAAEAEGLMEPVPMDSRSGLVLIAAATTTAAPPLPWDQTPRRLLVCNSATGRHLVLPPEPEPFPKDVHNPEQYVLLVGDRYDGEGGAGAGAGTAIGRLFQVLKVMLLLCEHDPSYRRLLVQTFSSEDGSWSQRMEIPTPNIHGRYACRMSLLEALVVGDVVHWLCLTNVGSYVLMLHVRDARVSETALPPTFPRDAHWTRSYLLATDSAGRSLVVLVADAENIRAWEQCKGTESKMMWKAWPRVMIHKEAILGFNDEVKDVVLRFNYGVTKGWAVDQSKRRLELLWFGERSGVVLLQTHGCCLLWLDLHSKKIVRCFCSDRLTSYAQVYCPYEMDVSSWTPTFSSAVTI